MYKKRCDKCGKASYSLSRKGLWYCPGCGADLADAPILTRDRSTADVLPLKGFAYPCESRN